MKDNFGDKHFEKGQSSLHINGGDAGSKSWDTIVTQLEKDTLYSLYIEHSTFDAEEPPRWPGQEIPPLALTTERFLKALKSNKSLKQFTLKESNIGKSLAKVFETLTSHPTLQTLTVRQYEEYEFDNKSVVALANILKQNSNLKMLALQQMILKQDITVLCREIASSRSLTELNLYDLKLSDANAVLIIDAIKANNNLQVNGYESCEPQSLVEQIKTVMKARQPKTLLKAVEYADLAQVKSMLQSPDCTEADLLAVNTNNETALYAAIQSSNIEIASEIVMSPLCTERVLLKNRCGFDQDTALHMAVKRALIHKNLDIMAPIIDAHQITEEVLAAQDTEGDTALHSAMKRAPNEIMIRGKSDFNPLNVIGMLLPSCTEKVLLTKNRQGNTPLHLAINFAMSTGYTSILKSTLSLKGCTQRVLEVTNANGETILDIARSIKEQSKMNIVNLVTSKYANESAKLASRVTTPSNQQQTLSQLPQAHQNVVVRNAQADINNDNNIPHSFSGINMQILGGFIAVLGAGAIAISFVALNAAIFGMAGLMIGSGVGAALLMTGLGLFAYGTIRDCSTPLESGASMSLQG